MKIGVTSQNFRTITGHAGKTRRFMVFSEDRRGQWAESERLDLPRDMSMHEFNGFDHPIDQLDVLITAGCGKGFINKMAQRGVHVVQTGETDPLIAVDHYARGMPLKAAQPHHH